LRHCTSSPYSANTGAISGRERGVLEAGFNCRCIHRKKIRQPKVAAGPPPIKPSRKNELAAKSKTETNKAWFERKKAALLLTQGVVSNQEKEEKEGTCKKRTAGNVHEPNPAGESNPKEVLSEKTTSMRRRALRACHWKRPDFATESKRARRIYKRKKKGEGDRGGGSRNGFAVKSAESTQHPKRERNTLITYHRKARMNGKREHNRS